MDFNEKKEQLIKWDVPHSEGTLIFPLPKIKPIYYVMQPCITTAYRLYLY